MYPKIHTRIKENKNEFYGKQILCRRGENNSYDMGPLCEQHLRNPKI